MPVRQKSSKRGLSVLPKRLKFKVSHRTLSDVIGSSAKEKGRKNGSSKDKKRKAQSFSYKKD